MSINTLAVAIIGGVLSLALIISITVLLSFGEEVPPQFYDTLTLSVGGALLGGAVTQGASKVV